MSALQPGIVSWEDNAYVIDAEVLASKLGLAPDRLLEEMRRGLVVSTTERGEGEDAGRMRLTFRYRAKAWVVVINADGSLHEVPPESIASRPPDAAAKDVGNPA